MAGGNRFDNLVVDVPELYSRWPLAGDWAQESASVKRIGAAALYACRWLPLDWRVRSWRKLRASGWDDSWFRRFRGYWQQVLGGRPLWEVHDFHFLLNQYRVKFQSSQLGLDSGEAAHLAAWQAPELLYQLFHLARREALVDQYAWLARLRRWRPDWRVLWEFGCGTAPLVTFLDEFFPLPPGRQVYLSDLATLAFHYAVYKFRGRPNVRPLLLQPEKNFFPSLPQAPDVIFCLTVFEHLPQPLETARRLHAALAPGGLLGFDYIQGDGGGMDTAAGVAQRTDTLRFLADHFEPLEGEWGQLDRFEPMLARKKGGA